MIKKSPEEYKGPSEFVTALGQSTKDGMVGGATGAVVGGVMGAASHNAEKSRIIREGLKHKLAEEAGTAWKEELKISAKELEEAERFIEKSGTMKTLWTAAGRGEKAFMAALGAGVIVGTVTQFTGFFRGRNKAKEGRAQFDQITSENKDLTHQLELTKERLENKKSFISRLESERKEPSERSTER